MYVLYTDSDVLKSIVKPGDVVLTQGAGNVGGIAVDLATGQLG